MNTFVAKQDLLDKLKANRDAHKGIYEQAYEAYCAQLIDDLTKALADAKNNKPVRVYSSLPIPEDHTSSYDNMITLLEMSVDSTIELDDEDVKRYVLNHWEWEHSFAANTLRYTEGR